MKIWQKLRKLQFFQFEAWSSREDTCCYNILLSVNPFTMVTNYLRQFWHITLMTIPQLAIVNLNCSSKIFKASNRQKGSLVKNLGTSEVILAIEKKNDPHKNVLLINFKN